MFVGGFKITTLLVGLLNILIGGLLVAIVKTRPALKKIATEREANLPTERAAEMESMRKRLAEFQARLEEKDKQILRLNAQFALPRFKMFVMRPFMSKITKAALLVIASVGASRAFLNRQHLRQTPYQRARFHGKYAKIFRRWSIPVASGIWLVKWRDTLLRIPLRRGSMWLDWDVALSITAHDVEVKNFYSAMLDGGVAPELFVDIGANYGTHTLLMASQGISVIAFEPLGSCAAYARALCEANGLNVDIRQTALGDSRGEVTLSYPERDTWLATAANDLSAHPDTLVTEKVIIARLDDFLIEFAGRRLLIKLDVEGLEAAVLRGASRLLATRTAVIVFETLAGSDRASLWEIFAASNYRVEVLPPPGTGLSRSEFEKSMGTNFAAFAN